MSDELTVQAASRDVFGKGASRRLRRENRIPAILYGADEAPQPIMLRHNEIQKQLSNDAFYSSLIMVSVDGGEPARTILRDVQRHPYKQQILHVDFQRVVKGAELTMTVPLHYVGEDVAPGVKDEGGIVMHNDNEVSVACRPRDIPEFIEVDMSTKHVGDTVHLSNLVLPEGVRLTDLGEAGDDSDRVIASVVLPRQEIEPEPTEDTALEADGTAEDGDAPDAGAPGDGAAATDGDESSRD